MMFSHEWGLPGIVVVRQDGRAVNTAQEACVKCGTTRNPFTMQLIRGTRRAEWCRDAPPAAEHPNRKRKLDMVRRQLDALEHDGYDVDREYGRRRAAPPELPLAYKD